MNRFNICDKSKVPQEFNNKYNKNNINAIGQWTIAANINMQMYITIIQIRTILITHRINKDCRDKIRNKYTPCCNGNWLHITY